MHSSKRSHGCIEAVRSSGTPVVIPAEPTVAPLARLCVRPLSCSRGLLGLARVVLGRAAVDGGEEGGPGDWEQWAPTRPG